MTTEDAEYQQLVEEARLRKKRVTNAKACAWIAVVPATLLMVIGAVARSLPEGQITACVIAGIIVSLGNGFATGHLVGWDD